MTTLTRRNPLATQSDITLASETNAPGSPITELLPSEIRIDAGLQTRDKVNQEKIAEYAEAMANGDQFPPLLVYRIGTEPGYLLVKGFHRFNAHIAAFDRKPIRCKITHGSRREALKEALADNADHGLPLTREDKRKKIKIALADAEWGQWSDREIAKLCKVSHPLVAEVRREVTGNSSSDNTRTYTNRHGTTSTMRTERIRQANSARSSTATTNDESGDKPRPLTVDETLAVILRAARNTSPLAGGQLSFVRSNNKADLYRNLLTDQVTIDATCFREAHQQATVLLEAEARKAAGRSATIIQRVEAEYDTANPLAIPTRSDRIQALRKLCQSLIDNLPDYGDLTGDFTGTLALRRALEPMIRKLEENQIEPKAQLPQSPTADVIEQAIRQWIAGEQRKAGMTKYISPVTWWMWVLYLVPSDVGVKCSLNDFRQVIGQRFGELRDEAIQGGWQPIPDLEKETWWQAATPKENLV